MSPEPAADARDGGVPPLRADDPRRASPHRLPRRPPRRRPRPSTPPAAPTSSAPCAAARLRDAADLARIGRVTLTGSREDFPLFDAVFAAWFGDAPGVPTAAPEEETAAPPRDRPGRDALVQLAGGAASGRAASPDEVAAARTFRPAAEDERRALARLRAAFARLPEVERRRWVPSARRPPPRPARAPAAPRAAPSARPSPPPPGPRGPPAPAPPPRRRLRLDEGPVRDHAPLRPGADPRPRAGSRPSPSAPALPASPRPLRRRDGEAALARLAAERSATSTAAPASARRCETFLARLTNAALARGAVVARLLRRPRARRPAADDRAPSAASPASPTAWSGPARSPPTRATARSPAPWPASCPTSTLWSTAAASRRWPACRTASPPSSASPAARPGAPSGRHPNDRHRRRAPPHLAAGRPALAAGPDGAAHLRPLRADPPRLSDRGISRRHRRHRRREVRLRADQLGQAGAVDEVAWVQATADAHGWPHAIVGYADLLDDDVGRHPETPVRLPAHARRPDAAPLAREPAIPLRRQRPT